jgi:hypothetical protein
MKALVFDAFGSSDVLAYRELPKPERQAAKFS